LRPNYAGKTCTRQKVEVARDGYPVEKIDMQIALRPALARDFDYCFMLYFDNMKKFNEELNLDPVTQAASFQRQWHVDEVQIITLGGADIGWLQSTMTRARDRVLGQLFVDGQLQRKGIGTAVINRLIDEANKDRQAMTLGVVKTNPALRLYERMGFHITHEDDRKFYMRREADPIPAQSN
jgi:GNAT superfamily N-acetyltransferase